MSTPTLRLDDLPPAFASKLLYSLFSHFLGEGIEYDEVTNTVKCTDCNKFMNELKNYVGSQGFNNVMSRYFQLIDGMSAGKCLGTRIGKVQDLVKGILNNVRSRDVFAELSAVNIQAGPTYVKITWGTGNFIGFNLTPPIIASVDYMEALRRFMPEFLTVKRDRVRDLSKDVVSGSYKAVEVSCSVYALVAIGYSLSVITRFEDTYAFIIPLTFDRELIERMRMGNVRERLEKGLARVNINAVEDHLINLLLVSAIRSRSGAVELALLERGGGRNLMTKAEFVIDLSMYRPLVEALMAYDTGNSFTELVAAVIRDEQSSEPDKRDVAGKFSDVLRKLLFIASNVGNAETHAYEALRVLNSINPSDLDRISGGGTYRWGLMKLPGIIMDTLELSKALFS